MRKMKNIQTGTEINVVEHFILRNLWEYYITDEQVQNDCAFALVMGYETELGDVYLPEVKDYIISRTKNLTDLLPATGWEWVA